MATHNHVRIIGFLTENPKIINEGIEGAEKVMYCIKTIVRPLREVNDTLFQDVLVFYDGNEYITKMKALKRFDLVDIQGVINIINMHKRSSCPECHNKNIKYNGTASYVYPRSFVKLNALETAYEHNVELPEQILKKYFSENSNEAIIVGNVVNTPELMETEKGTCCRYQLGINRKYFIATQPDTTADYPWVYSYAKQALDDYEHLQSGTLVLLYGYIRNRGIKNNMICEKCGIEYQFKDVATEFVPYSVEYLKNDKTEIQKKNS